jgi:hypothetical protein
MKIEGLAVRLVEILVLLIFQLVHLRMSYCI